MICRAGSQRCCRACSQPPPSVILSCSQSLSLSCARGRIVPAFEPTLLISRACESRMDLVLVRNRSHLYIASPSMHTPTFPCPHSAREGMQYCCYTDIKRLLHFCRTYQRHSSTCLSSSQSLFYISLAPTLRLFETDGTESCTTVVTLLLHCCHTAITIVFLFSLRVCLRRLEPSRVLLFSHYYFTVATLL